MDKKVNDFIYITNILPESLCRELVDTISQRDWDKHAWYSSKSDSTRSEQEKELDVQHSDEELHHRVAPFIVEAGRQYNTKFAVSGAKTTQFISRFTPGRFNRYETGTLMRKHYDHIHSIFDGDQKGIPVLSILALLNDDFEGGEFLVNDEVMDLKTGDMILFPSCFMFPHEVREVTAGTRYSYITWAF